jgi:hypothetical protein
MIGGEQQRRNNNRQGATSVEQQVRSRNMGTMIDMDQQRAGNGLVQT